MKRLALKYIIVAIALAFPVLLSGQGSSLPVVPVDSLPTALYDYLVSSTSKHFHDPSVPRFLIKDRSYNYVFGIGGYVQAFGLYDMSGMDNPSFVANSIPVNSRQYYNSDVTNINIGLSRLFFKLIGTTAYGMINAYIETDFNGENNVLRLRQAYIQYQGLTIGQAWTTFKDSESPNTLEPQGPVSMPDRRVPLIRYTLNVNKKIKMALGVEVTQTTDITIPNEYLGTGDDYTVIAIPQNIPDIPVSFEYTVDRFHAFAGYNMRYMKCPVDDGKYQNVFSCAAQLSFKYDFFKSSVFTHTFYGQGIYANGMVDCIQDMSGLGLNILLKSGMDVDVLSGFGYYAGYQMKWKQNEMNFVYSLSQCIGVGGYPGLYKRGEYAVANYMRDIAIHGKIGAEVVYGKKMLQGGESGNDFRLNILLRYDF